MNKQYMYVNGMIVVSDENGMKPARPYVDNIEDILILENEIEYLNRCLEEDQKKLSENKENREFRSKQYKKLTVVTTGAAVCTPLLLGKVIGLDQVETNTIFGIMNGLLAFAIPMTGAGIVFGQVCSLLGLSYKPSKNIVRCYEERITYEKEMIELLTRELKELISSNTSDRKDSIQEMIAYDVKDEGSIEFLRESIKLRDIFGYNEKKIMKLYEQGVLPMQLSDNGFSDIAIMDFLSFLERKSKEVSEKEQNNSLNKM